MSLSRKHFNALAKMVRHTAENGGSVSAATLAHELADFCAAENPAFDRARFLAACLEGTKQEHRI
jgi:hypothetical protein